jgi:hypothetical protein
MQAPYPTQWEPTSYRCGHQVMADGDCARAAHAMAICKWDYGFGSEYFTSTN